MPSFQLNFNLHIMSDIFNTGKGRSQILKFLGKGDVGRNVEDEFPLQWKPPLAPNLQNDAPTADVARFCRDVSLTLYKPRAIRESVTVPTEEVLGDRLNALMAEGSALKSTVLMPIGETEYLPKYDVYKWYNEPYDLPILKQVIYYHLTQDAWDSESNSPFIERLVEVAKTSSYGNGSLQGQLTRLAKMNKVNLGRDGYNAARPIIDCFETSVNAGAMTIEYPARMLEKYLPVGSVASLTDQGGWPGLFMKPSRYIDTGLDGDGEAFDWLPSISFGSSAGVPYLGKLKKDTLTEALALSDGFITRLSGILKAIDTGVPSAKETSQLRELLEDYWWLGCGFLFPKAERYKKENWFVKTRCIWSSPFPTHLLIALITTPAMKTSPNAVTFDTPSLYGFSPFHGGLDVIVNKAMRPGHKVFVYADNWYICYDNGDGTKDWYSIDLVSGEAQTTPLDGTLLNYYLLTRSHIDQDGRPAFSATWAYAALYIFPNFVIDSTALLRNLQIKQPGQGSGNTMTFLLNHVKVSSLCHRWETSGSPRPGTREFEKICEKTGCNVTVEAHITNLGSLLEEVKSKTLNEGYLQENHPDTPPPGAQPQVELDLLGWSAAWSHKLKRWVPVLASNRLAASIICPRGMSTTYKGDEAYMRLFYDVVRFESARLVGAWAHPGTDTALKMRAEEIRTKIMKTSMHRTGMDVKWENALLRSEMATLLTEGDVALWDKPEQPVTGETLLRLHEWQNGEPPKMTPVQYEAMMDRARFEESKIQTRAQIKLNPASAYLTTNIMQGLEKFTTNRGLEVDQKKLDSLIQRAHREMKKIQEIFVRAPVHQPPSIRPDREADAAVAANPLPAYHVDRDRPVGAFRAATGHGPAGEPKPLSRNAKKQRRRREKMRTGPDYD